MQCVKTSRPERAFFYLDEMAALKLDPDLLTFKQLFRACAEAPHWVDGYHDVIFDAMFKMEGAEMAPTTEIYNTIIYAFSRAGDAVAAEFYFWEMRRKGLKQDEYTYASLMFAFAQSQTVGAKTYGSKGRYAKPAARKYNEEEQAYVDVGAKRVTELLSMGISKEYDIERGSRQSGQVVDIMDDDEEVQAAFKREIMFEAKEIRIKRAELEAKRAEIAARDKDAKLEQKGTTHLLGSEDDSDDAESLSGVNDTDADDNNQDPFMKKLLAEMKMEEEKERARREEEEDEYEGKEEEDEYEGEEEEGEVDGYAEGEAQYDEWNKDDEIDSDMEGGMFSEADQTFLDKEGSSGDNSRESISAAELSALMKELGFDNGSGDFDTSDRDEKKGRGECQVL